VVEKNDTTGDWNVAIEEERGTGGMLPSQKLLFSVVEKMGNGSLGPKWVVVVHGYGQTFADSLEHAYALQKEYSGNAIEEQVNIILFSWPSKPGGTIVEPVTSYRKAQAAAIASAPALKTVLERVWQFLVVPALAAQPAGNGRSAQGAIEGLSVCLYVHSQGNLVLETLTRSKLLDGSSVRLDTIILHQADVDAKDHAEWVSKINYGGAVIITLNTFDAVLKMSDAINPERLGIASSELVARATYFDFTAGDRVNAEHNLFLNVDNKVVRLFCRRALTGFPLHQIGGESNGFWWDPQVGAWHLGVKPSGPRGGSSRPGS